MHLAEAICFGIHLSLLEISEGKISHTLKTFSPPGSNSAHAVRALLTKHVFVKVPAGVIVNVMSALMFITLVRGLSKATVPKTE
jgi:hypothetical protein